MPTIWIAVIVAGWAAKNEATPAVRRSIHIQHPAISPSMSVAALALPSESAVAIVQVRSGPGFTMRASDPMMYVASMVGIIAYKRLSWQVARGLRLLRRVGDVWYNAWQRERKVEHERYK